MSSIKILSAARKRAFDEVPKLTIDERKGYLIQDKATRKIVSSLRKNENKVGLLLQRAYFQAKGRFFNPSRYRPKDKRAAERALGLNQPCDLSKYSPKSQSHHKKLILDLYKWKPYTHHDKLALKSHALLHVDKQTSSEDILFSLLDFCWRNKTEIPSYRQLAEIISDSFLRYEFAILKKLNASITQEQTEILRSFLDTPYFVSSFSEMKRINQEVSQRRLNRSTEILAFFRDTFKMIEPLLMDLQLTPEAVKHFSDWVYKSNLSQIKQLKNESERFLRLIAFIQDQFFLRQDYAVDAFLKVMRGAANKARGFDKLEKEKEQDRLQEANKSVLSSAKSSQQILKLVIEISKNTAFTLSERNQKIRHLAESFFEAENPELHSHFQRIETNLHNNALRVNFHQHLFARSNQLQKSLSPIIQELLFDKHNSNQFLITAIEHFSDKKHTFNDNTPKQFLNKNDSKLVFVDGDIPQVSRYKIMLFIYIEKAIRNRSLTLEYSYRYRANRSYMISDKQWSKNKSELLEAARLADYADGKQVLNSMGKALSQTIEQVNSRYKRGDNEFLKVDSHGNWRLKKSEAEFDSSKYIPKLLSDSKFRPLYELLSEVDSYTNFSEMFSHISNKKAKTSVDNKMIYATLMSLGTNLGHSKMAKTTKGISSKNLRDTDKLWFSNRNIEKANSCIVKFIQNLPLPTIFNDKNDVIHTSSDGKKVIVAVNSLLANYSYKYYGKEQGISVNSFIDEKQSFFHVNVLTSSDREAPYMMDGIANTKSSLFHEGDAQHIHSTDTHGYTEAIFAGLHFLDVSFAPRIAKPYKQAIYAFEAKSLRKNSNNPIAPKTTINKKKILDNWDDILRLMATIKLGHCSASHLFKILASSPQDNKLYSALKELGRLIKSKFILNYIDDESLRKSIQKQLNRVELGQRLSEEVFFARKGRLHVGTADEMQQVMSCKTLLKNAIILWNYLFLSDYYHSLTSNDERRHVIESISNGSVISWGHINMHGLYDFDHKFKHSFKASIQEMRSIRINF